MHKFNTNVKFLYYDGYHIKLIQRLHEETVISAFLKTLEVLKTKAVEVQQKFQVGGYKSHELYLISYVRIDRFSR